VVLASDGLWEFFSNEEAVETIANHPRKGIAARLVTIAILRAAARRNMTYAELKSEPLGSRRHVHDDISCVVLFVDHDKLGKGVVGAETTASLGVSLIGGQKHPLCKESAMDPF